MTGLEFEIEELAIPSLLQPAATLAIECSEKYGSVALLQPSGISFIALPRQCSTAVSLAPAIQFLLQRCHLQVKQLKRICVTRGPGSFTGLRIGIGLARALSLGTSIPLVGVSSLATLACSHTLPSNSATQRSGLPFVTVLNAFRNELFVAAWNCGGEKLVRATSDTVIERKKLAEWAASAVATKDFRIVSPETSAFFVDLSAIQIAPTALGVLCAEAVELEQTVSSLDQILPTYLRRSAAEEKKDEISNIASRS